MNRTSPEALLNWFDRSDGVTTDTRKCGPGMLFFALKGERFDGNSFAHQALEAGCLAAVVDDPSVIGDNVLHVENVLQTLQSLANLHRHRFGCPVLGLTGSNGKTTTKELLRTVLSETFVVHATAGNLNNHIGVPLTLLSFPKDVEFAIVEMGANHQGEIAALSRIAEPTHGIITNVGMAHLEGFGGIEGVKKGKQELFVHLASKGGTAFVPASDKDLMALSKLEGLVRLCFGTTEHPPLSWRTNSAPGAPVYWSMNPPNPGPWHNAKGALKVELEGEHQLANMTAAMAVGHHFGVPAESICNALEAFQPVQQRGEVVETKANTVIIDCYNANPSSVESTLRAFAAAGHTKPLAILGDMMELGEHAPSGHRLVRDVATECGIECWTVGSIFAQYAPGDQSFDALDALQRLLDNQPESGRTILLKGSRSMRLETLVPGL